ncbi:DUF4082 domain-containing protein [Flavobacterium caeni]|uniref:Uncharacterized protein n=1 Tax=Flavobacterium caeni TaxID=490189 RepID=A0A1G5GAQ6_9FLAO|nr:DUF4082 domain-containing protein [Flavobacterium caeni]SCY48389.1 protein of unknown function [Flavobacterium caeni]
MKNIPTLAALLFAAMTIGCSSDDDNTTYVPQVFEEENTHDLLYSGDIFNAPISSAGENVIETGFEFKPKHNGTISKLTVKLAAPDPTTTVTLWDHETREILRTQTVNVSAASTLMEIDITPLAVEKDHLYTVSVETNALFSRTLKTGTIPPIEVGSITVTRMVNTDDEFSYPVDSYGVLFGDVGFKFKRSE